MAKKKQNRELRESEIVPLIDIVFLLLIFFLLTAGSFRLMESVERKEEYVTSRNLPQASGLAVSPNDPIRNMLIRIEEDSSASPGNGQKLIYFLEPSNEVFAKAFKTAKKDSNFIVLSNDTLNMDRDAFLNSWSCRIMTRRILNYRTTLLDIPINDRTLEISADKNTPFRLIYFLMEQCSQGDSQTAIKKVNIRTLGGMASTE